MNGALTSDMLVCAFLSQDPGALFAAADVAEGLGGVHIAIVHRALMRQSTIGVISHVKLPRGRVRYFTTNEQAEAIQRDLRALAASIQRWLVDVPEPPPAPDLPPLSTLKGPGVS